MADRVPAARAELNGPPLPAAMARVWSWFVEVSMGRGGGGFGPAPLSWPVIDAWARLMRRQPTPFEIECFFALDAARLNALNDKADG